MKHTLTLCRIALGLAVATCLATPVSGESRAVYRVGIAIDGPWERNDQIRGIFEQEILELIRDEFDIRFPAAKRQEADWTLKGVRAVVDRLLADPEVDILLTAGPISSAYVCHLSELPKPVIAPFIFSTEIQGVPFRDGKSGVKNLSYVTFQHDLGLELKTFQEIVPFSKVVVLVSQGLHDALPALQEWYELEMAGLGLEASYIPVAESAEEALSMLPDDTEAVYVGALLQLTADEHSRFVAGLIERRLPSFAMWGRDEVEAGLFAGLYVGTDFERLGRRIALNLHRILRGEDASDIPVAFRRGQRLAVNMATGRAIGVYPPWRRLIDADVLHEEPTGVARSLSLASVVREAVEVNLDLAAADRSVAAGGHAVEEVRSRLRPNLEVVALGTIIDRDRAEASFGAVGERTLSGSLVVSQLIYSEPARADVEVQTHLQASREQEREHLRLDIALDTATAYLNVLRARAIEGIQRDNLALTRSNLELARARQIIGMARPAEVHRWESDLALTHHAALEAVAQRQQAEIALNRLLHRPLEESFTAEKVDLTDPGLMIGPAQLHAYIDNERRLAILRDFMAQEALAASPELRQIDAGIAAQERALLSATRAFASPSVSLQGELTRSIEGGSGSDGGLDLSFPMSLPQADNTEWAVGVRAALPLVDGGMRRAAKRRAEENLAELHLARQATAERIEQRLRSVFHDASASYVGIELSQAAAEAADENLRLVTEAYGQGAIPIIEVLDAQNAALVADLLAANALHDFLIDLMAMQRAMGKFGFLLSPSEGEAFFDRLEEYFSSAPTPTRTH